MSVFKSAAHEQWGDLFDMYQEAGPPYLIGCNHQLPIGYIIHAGEQRLKVMRQSSEEETIAHFSSKLNMANWCIEEVEEIKFYYEVVTD
jgi:hypothetical protein